MSDDESGWIWYLGMEITDDEEKKKKCPECGSNEIEQDYEEVLECQKCGYKWDPNDLGV